MQDKDYLMQAIRIAGENVTRGGEPFGAVLVHNEQVLAEGVNETYIAHDPTAHAEIQALRNASRKHATSSHKDTTMYASGIPCAMCMSAMIAAGVRRVVYCADDTEGAPYGWSTQHLYARMQKDFGEQGVIIEHMPLAENRPVFEAWKQRFGLGSNDNMKL